MALQSGDFVEPKGELREDMFPGVDDLTATGGHIETWLGEAQDKTDDEDAQEHWVYYRAYHQVWLRLTTNPQQADLDEEGSLRYTDKQVASFKELADQHREEFEDVVGETDEPQGRSVRSQSRSSTTSWV